ncbi:MAG: class I SAM-dependent methyltransferase [Solirubrobacterales bacterium]
MDEKKPISGASSRRNLRLGRALNQIVTRAPWLWPVIRNPMRSFFDQRAQGWDERTAAGSPEHLAPLAAGLLEVSPAPERALEIGTGTGTGALLIAREFPRARVRGVDISEQMVHHARKRIGLDPEGRVAFRVADASSLPYQDESFDLVAELNMPPFFAEIARLLRPGGFLVHGSSWGAETPFWTPEEVLRRRFAKHGIEEVKSGGAARGSFWVGRK